MAPGRVRRSAAARGRLLLERGCEDLHGYSLAEDATRLRRPTQASVEGDLELHRGHQVVYCSISIDVRIPTNVVDKV